MQIESQVDIGGAVYKQRLDHHTRVINEFEDILSSIKKGSGEECLEREHKKNKLTARERISNLIDENSQFLELSSFAAYKVYEDEVPAAGIITGVGKVSGRLCMIVANDQTVKGGTYYPLTVKKHLRAQEIAEKNHLPCLYLVDSGGAFLPMQDEVFPSADHFGRIFYNQARMSSKGISQISSVHGFCTAGGAYIPAMSDQSIIVKDTGTIFLGGPPLVKAATGEDISAQDLGGAFVHTQKSGVSDHLAENDHHALFILREIVSHLKAPKKANIKIVTPKDPLYDPNEILGIKPEDYTKPFNMKELLARVVDSSYFFEFKKEFAPTLITGFAHINGIPVGIIANNGVLFSDSALKGTHFIELCCQENIPLLFLQNITGFMVGKKYEHEGIAKHGAKLVHAVSNARVPKVTVMIGGSFGAGNYGMCGRAFDPNFLFMCPSARISVMGGKQAAMVLTSVKEQQLQKKGIDFPKEERERIHKQIEQKYEKEGHAYYSSARLWDDGIVNPCHLRQTLSQALSATLYHEWEESRFGIFRM